MAGIGFALRKLSRRDDLLGIVQGFAHSSLASSGPWLITILALAGIGILTPNVVHYTELTGFRIIIIYNFAFSLVLSGPTVALVTRCLSDQIYKKDVRTAPGMLLGALLAAYLVQFPVAAFYYFRWVEMEPLTRVGAFVNLFLISGIWLVSVFLTALKSFHSVTRSFAAGMILAVGSALLLAPRLGSDGLLIGFNLGLALTLYSLLARVLAEYPYPVNRPFEFLGQIRQYREVALGGLVYNLAIWVDKFVMWTGSEAEVLSSGMVSYPDYDSAMFAAYLTIVPSLAVFVYSIETGFFERYLAFYRSIIGHGTYREIADSHRRLVIDLVHSGRNFLVIQFAISLCAILLAPQIFESLNISFAQIGMFRLGVLGAYFHVLFLFTSIILSYFDMRTINLLLYSLFLAANFGFSLLSLHWGFPYYGYGYFMAALFAFVLAFLVTVYFLKDLPYYTFVRGHSVSQPF